MGVNFILNTIVYSFLMSGIYSIVVLLYTNGIKNSISSLKNYLISCILIGTLNVGYNKYTNVSFSLPIGMGVILTSIMKC